MMPSVLVQHEGGGVGYGDVDMRGGGAGGDPSGQTVDLVGTGSEDVRLDETLDPTGIVATAIVETLMLETFDMAELLHDAFADALTPEDAAEIESADARMHGGHVPKDGIGARAQVSITVRP
ncbi:hypothetical protein WJX72_006619 [[Myrmecia] bisecta]|uniref:Uncharacterized protein n=1 Tax=[Myrmecia] bisecta TaxID=41462 RepID=A0AAW1P0R1_9CHLO